MELDQRSFASLNITRRLKMSSNMNPIIRIFVVLLSVLTASIASAADYPAPTEGDFTIRDFKFHQAKHCRSCASIIGRSEHRKKMRKAKRQMPF